MAYNFFPKTVPELTEGIKNFGPKEQSEIVALYTYLSAKFKIDTPINIDKAKTRNVNVTRMLDGDTSVADINREVGLSTVKIKFGNGSSGNRGVNNRGNLFEPQFDQALQDWWAGRPVADKAMLAAIEHLDKTYNIRKSKTFKSEILGGENTKRPLKFSPSIQLTNPKGRGFDVGESVTDITVHIDNRPIYLSLKLGGTTTFFNVGVRTILTPAQIKGYNITNADGLKLLKLFNLDPQMFCQIFNQDWPKGQQYRYSYSNYDKSAVRTLLQSGIGYNYHIIHKMRGTILSKEMSEQAMKTAATPGMLTVYYGGKTGGGRRIDMELESSTYKFKLNIRDTQGGDGYPTRMMCDFSYK